MKKLNHLKRTSILILLCINAGSIFTILAQNGGWEQVESMNMALGGSASCVMDSMIYVFGGINTSMNVETVNSTKAYNTKTDEWLELEPMPIEISYPSADVINDTIFTVGGWHNPLTGDWYTIDSTFEYESKGNNWKLISRCPKIIGAHTSGVLNNKIYILGGLRGVSGIDSSEQKEALVFDPSNDTWDTIPNMLFAHGERSSACTYDGQIFIFGGLFCTPDQLIIIGKTERYIPDSNKWEELEDMPIPVVNHISLAYNDKLYIFGGDSGIYTHQKGNVTNIIQEYDPLTNQWQLMKNMPFKRSDMTGQEIGNSLYLMGGYSINSRNFGSAESEVWRFNLDSLKYITTDVIENKIHHNFTLLQNYPNPFRENTQIKYNLQQEGEVQEQVYNFLGQEITILVNTLQGPGIHEVTWNAEGYPAGIYLFKLKIGSYSECRKLILIN